VANSPINAKITQGILRLVINERSIVRDEEKVVKMYFEGIGIRSMRG
jgi:hypothetical protein